MRKILLIPLTFILTVLLIAAPLLAFTTKGDDDVSITTSIKDDVYAFGRNVSLSGEIDGDLVTAGGNLELNGSVKEDLMAAGGFLNFYGNVDDDARMAGGMINIDGQIKDDLIVAGGQITLGKSSEVGGDLVVTGGTLELMGNFKGDVIANGSNIIVSGNIAGNLQIDDVEELEIKDGAVIDGNVNYKSARSVKISDGAQIGGEITGTIVKKAEKQKIDAKTPWAVFTATYIGGKIISFLSLFVLGLILLLVLPKYFKNFYNRMKSAPGLCAGMGAIMLFGVPVALIILFVIMVLLFITIIGAGLGLITLSVNAILLVLYMLFIYISTIFLSYFIGRLIILKTAMDMDKYGWKVLAYLIGLVVIVTLYSIPFAGWVFRLAGILFAFGGMTLVIKEWLSKKK